MEGTALPPILKFCTPAASRDPGAQLHARCASHNAPAAAKQGRTKPAAPSIATLLCFKTLETADIGSLGALKTEDRVREWLDALPVSKHVRSGLGANEQLRSQTMPLRISHHLRPSKLLAVPPAQVKHTAGMPPFSHQAQFAAGNGGQPAWPSPNASLSWITSHTCSLADRQQDLLLPALLQQQAAHGLSPCFSPGQRQTTYALSGSVSLSISSGDDLDQGRLLSGSKSGSDMLSDPMDHLMRCRSPFSCSPLPVGVRRSPATQHVSARRNMNSRMTWELQEISNRRRAGSLQVPNENRACGVQAKRLRCWDAIIEN
eukprot:jgi/Ulvmu1/5398/UM022_0193.1